MDGGWRLAAAPVVVIGADDSQPEYQFRSVRSGAVREDGSVVVADADLADVRLYDPRGGYLMSYGARGRGPGEYQNPVNVVLAADDAVHVWDGALWRRTRFSADGELLSADRYDPTEEGLYPAAGMYPEQVRQTGDGWLGIQLAGKVVAKGAAGAKGAGDPTGGPTNSNRGQAGVALHRFGQPALEFMIASEGPAEVDVAMPWGPMPIQPPTSPGTRFAIDPRGGRVCMGDQAAPIVACYDQDGRTRSVRLEVERRPLTAAAPEVERWRAATGDLLAMKVDRAQVEQGLRNVPIPSFYPWFGELVVDALGNLWVSDAYAGPEGRVWQVFDGELDLLGALTLPDMTILEIKAETVLGVIEGALGVQTVAVFRLDRSVPRP